MFDFITNRKGMSIIEVLVAVTILSILIAPLASLFIISNQRARRTVVARQALAVAEAHIESLRDTGFEGYLDLDEAGSFQEWDWDPGERFFGTIRSEVFIEHTVKLIRVTVIVAWESGEVSLTTLVSKQR